MLDGSQCLMLSTSLQEEMENRDIMCEMRVVPDPKIYGEYHDRWILSSNVNYNLMSASIAKRGQYAERKKTEIL
jgi:hypothetical protein